MPGLVGGMKGSTLKTQSSSIAFAGKVADVCWFALEGGEPSVGAGSMIMMVQPMLLKSSQVKVSEYMTASISSLAP
jgi:hypothetical protein